MQIFELTMKKELLLIKVVALSYILLLTQVGYGLEKIHFYQSRETLQEIKEVILQKKKGVYLRFGDGDLNLAHGKADMYQKSLVKLQQEMREAFGLCGPQVFKCLNLQCKEFGGWEQGMFPGNHETPFQLCVNIIKQARQLWSEPITKVYSPVALHFTATQYPHECIHFLKTLRNLDSCILVGNRDIPRSIQKLLFGPHCLFVPTPPKQAYASIDKIEAECLRLAAQDDNYKIIVTGMGCSGRALQKRLWQKLDNVFLFDFGSLMDALCGWDTRAWISLSHFNVDHFMRMFTQDIKIICTAALLNNQYEMRKQEYEKALKQIIAFGYEPYIVEACKQSGPTFLDSYSSHVLYSNVNDARLKNKGVNEARSLIEATKVFNFHDNDMVIKLTGRYYLNSDMFIKLIKANPEYDAFVKVDAYGQVLTGCFGIRYKHLKGFLHQLDFALMERNMINIEFELKTYLEKMKAKGMKVYYCDKIDLTMNVFGTGECALVQRSR